MLQSALRMREYGYTMGHSFLTHTHVLQQGSNDYINASLIHGGGTEKLHPNSVCLLATDATLAVLTAERRTLPCKARSVQGVQYRKISWYKVIGPEYRGLVMKNLRDNTTTVYRGANPSYEVGVEFALLLPESALGDCGTYQCTLWPPLGHYIQEGQHEYYPPGCVRPTEALPMMPLADAHSSCCDISRNLAAWGIPAALILFIIIAGSVLCLYQRQKKYKLADTI